MFKKIIGSKIVLYVLAFLITIFFVFNGKYISTGYKIEVGQVSNVQLKATRDVENVLKTQIDTQNILDTTEARYTIDKSITVSVLDAIEDFFIIADSERLAYREYNASFVKADGTSPEFEKYKSDRLSTFLTAEEDVYAVLSASEDEYNAFKAGTVAIVTNTLETGVKDSDLDKNQLYVTEQFNALNTSQSLKEIGIKTYETFFRANLIVDEQATNQAIEDRLNELEPEIFLKGQTIVDDGDIVTEEQYQMLKQLGFVDTSISEKTEEIFGIIALILCIFIVGGLYYAKIYSSKKRFKKNEEIMLFYVYIVSLFLIWSTSSLPIYLSPVLISIILVGVFLGYKFGVFYSIFLTLVSSLIIASDLQYILFVLISTSFAAILSKGILTRKNVYKIAGIYSIFNTFLYFSIQCLFVSSLSIGTLITCSYIFMQALITIIICVGIIPIFEIIFLVLTPNKLMELSNPENELLKKCRFEAPGTYHHSLIVANLCEVAAMEIGANPALARVGAYYHDIGKLAKPFCFSENQLDSNIHDNLDPIESFKVIVEHVDNGIALAKKYKLPKEIINLIPEHHGTTLVKYFYIKAKNENPDDQTITEDMFRYNGSKPQTKEAAILMFADTCEAAVRSMINKVSDIKEVEALVSTLIKAKIDDNQLSECDLTFNDVEIIKESFMSVFKGMYHQRVEYPKLLKEKQEKKKEKTESETDTNTEVKVEVEATNTDEKKED